MRSASPGPGPSTLQRRQEAIQRQIKRWSRDHGVISQTGTGSGSGLVKRRQMSEREPEEEGDAAHVLGERRDVGEKSIREVGSQGSMEDRVVHQDKERNAAVMGTRVPGKRQAGSSSSSSSSSDSSSFSVISSTSYHTFTSSTSTGNGLYGTSLTATGTSTTLTPYQSSTTSLSTTVNANTFTASWITTSRTSTTTTSTGTNTGSSTSSTTTTTSSKTSAAAQYVPTAGVALKDGANGLVLNMTLNGDSVGEAIYAVPIIIGHHESSSSRRRGLIPSGVNTGGDRKRATAEASDYQSVMLQVDLGSSDMWVAASTCTTTACQGKGVTLFDAGDSLDADVSANLTYQAGYASGEVYWDEVQLGVTISDIVTAVNGTGNGGSSGFDISAQAFIAADQVAQEDLSGGVFSGILGLALPANSVISDLIPGTYGSSPDGATFLDNLFASGVSAPNARYFTLSLGRDGDTRTRSSLGIGKHDDFVCPAPCSPSFNSLVSSSCGPLYWRVLLQAITFTNYTNPTSATSGWSSPQNSSIPMTSASSNVLGTTVPVAVLDSGGSQVLFANRGLLDSIYANIGVTMSSDGYYYMPCTTPVMLSFQFNGVAYPVHPLDMSDYYTETTTCIGSMQYAAGLTAGDIILGSTFLKNAYSVFSYPSAESSSSSWSPQVGLVSLTNASAAAQEFYNVRSLQESIASATAATSGATGTSSQAAAAAAGSHVLSVGAIAAVAVVGFVAVAAGLFCGWFFWIKRKRSRNAQGGEPAGGFFLDDKTDGDSGTQRQSKKSSMFMARQKSMIDGYSDFETLSSWPNSESKTDMAYDEPDEMHLVEELDGAGNVNGVTATPESGHHRRRPSNWESSYPPVGWSNSSESRGRTGSPSGGSPRRTLTYGTPPAGINNESAPDNVDHTPALMSPARQPLIRLVSDRQDKDKSRPRGQSVGSVFEMEQMGYAKQLARHARDGSSGSGSFIPMASPGHVN